MPARLKPAVIFTESDVTIQVARGYLTTVALPRIAHASNVTTGYPDTPNTPYLDGDTVSYSAPSYLGGGTFNINGRLYPDLPINS